MADGKVVFEITADGKHAIADIKDITKQIDKETKKWDAAVDESTSNMEGSFSSFLKGVAKGIAAAGIGKMLLDLSKEAISAASDLAEVQNVVDVTFGESSSKIEAWSKQAGKQYGLTETAAKRYTSTIGAMLKSQGMADDEIVQTSTDLAGLAADIASFYNLEFDEAFQKIRSGISGETEPLKALGINMSAANLEAFRLEKGITKAFSAMSQGEQTALRYQYIMQATADAQGDFARTADGYANASRRMETAMETIKTKGGALLLEVVEPLATGLAGILEDLTSGEITTALDDFASIDEKTGQKVSSIQKTAQDAETLADVLTDLSKNTSLTEEEQAQWLETCKRLVQTIPGLSSIINTETGEVKGGTDAVKEYVKAWEEGQTKLAMLGAIQQKEDALASRFSDIPGLQLDLAVAERRVRENRKQIDALLAKYGLTKDNIGYDIVMSTEFAEGFGISAEDWRAYNDLVQTGFDLEESAEAAKDAYDKQAAALEEAKKALEEYRDTVKEMPGDTEAATKALEEWQKAAKEVGPALLDSAKQALSALADYVQGVHDATETAVNGVVKGFDRLTKPTTELEEKRSKLIEQQMALNRGTEEGRKKYEELESQINDLNKSINEYSPKGMKEGLESQLAFMQEYVDNLEKARQMGLSDELLASLSDGSVQSATYLAGLVSTGNEQMAGEVDALYQQVQAKKKEFTNALTDQKLTADETYQSLVDTATAAVEQLDLGQDAEDAMKNTVEGLAKGLAAGVPDLSSAVDSVIAQLNRLSGFGISVSTPTFGNLLTTGRGGVGQYSTLSTPGVNYDTLGDVISGNTKAAGNVYLNGREVGKVISTQQANDYRAMTRSGVQYSK